MPVEIREMVVRAVVNDAAERPSPSSSDAQSSAQSPSMSKVMEQVAEMMNKKNER